MMLGFSNKPVLEQRHPVMERQQRLKENLQKLQDIKSDIIFFQAGVDSLDSDNLGYLLLDHDGLKDRNELVLNFAKRRGNPIVIFMGGGYSKPIKHTVTAFKELFIQCALFSL